VVFLDWGCNRGGARGNWPQFPFSGCSWSGSVCSSDSLFCALPTIATTRRNILRFLGCISPFSPPQKPLLPTSPSSYRNACINYYFLDSPSTCCQMLLQHFLLAALALCSVLHILVILQGSRACGVCDCSGKIIKSWRNTWSEIGELPSIREIRTCVSWMQPKLINNFFKTTVAKSLKIIYLFACLT